MRAEPAIHTHRTRSASHTATTGSTPSSRTAASAPVEDQRGPVDYKRHLADELTRRVLRRSIERAGAMVPA